MLNISIVDYISLFVFLISFIFIKETYFLSMNSDDSNLFDSMCLVFVIFALFVLFISFLIYYIDNEFQNVYYVIFSFSSLFVAFYNLSFSEKLGYDRFLY